MIEQMFSTGRQLARRVIPDPYGFALRARRTGISALVHGIPGLTAPQVRVLFRDLQEVSDHVTCGHGEEELLRVVIAIVGTPPEVPGVVVECGCWKGGSSAKMSLAAGLVSRKMFVFDSFQGIPANDQGFSRTIHGQAVAFAEGEYSGSIDEVRDNIYRFGDLATTTLVPGWLEDTLPSFSETVAVAYLDVDLVSSTRTCMEYLWPRLAPGGIIFSQDGHIAAVLDALEDDDWWQENLHCKAPRVFGAGHEKLIYVTK